MTRAFEPYVALELLCGKRIDLPVGDWPRLAASWERSFVVNAPPDPFIGVDLFGAPTRFNASTIEWLQLVTAEAQAKREAAARAEDERQRQDDEGEERWR